MRERLYAFRNSRRQFDGDPFLDGFHVIISIAIYIDLFVLNKENHNNMRLNLFTVAMWVIAGLADARADDERNLIHPGLHAPVHDCYTVSMMREVKSTGIMTTNA